MSSGRVLARPATLTLDRSLLAIREVSLAAFSMAAELLNGREAALSAALAHEAAWRGGGHESTHPAGVVNSTHLRPPPIIPLGLPSEHILPLVAIIW